MNERDLIELASRQHGIVTHQQVLTAGWTDAVISRRLRTGRWKRLRSGVYIVGGVPPSWEQLVLGACLAGGPDVVASHRTAARLWGLVSADGRTEVTVAGVRRVRLPQTKVHQSVLLPALDRTRRRGVPVTNLARTLADTSSHQDPLTVGLWLDQAMRNEHLSLLELRSCVARLSGPGRRDLRPIRAALALRLPGYDPGDSELEVRALRALHDSGLPAPVQQFQVRRLDGRLARIDLAYPAEMVAIELDGWDHHGRRSAFDPDRIRRNELTLLGWNVYQFTSTMSDDVLTATIAAALGLAGAHRAS